MTIEMGKPIGAAVEEARKCALGWLVPDDAYTPKLELMNELYRFIAGADFFATVRCQMGRFLASLGSAHDLGRSPEQMKADLQKVVREWDLAWPEDVQ